MKYRYENKNRTKNWLQRLRLQLPAGVTNLGSVIEEHILIKMSREKFILIMKKVVICGMYLEKWEKKILDTLGHFFNPFVF